MNGVRLCNIGSGTGFDTEMGIIFADVSGRAVGVYCEVMNDDVNASPNMMEMKAAMRDAI